MDLAPMDARRALLEAAGTDQLTDKAKAAILELEPEPVRVKGSKDFPGSLEDFLRVRTFRFQELPACITVSRSPKEHTDKGRKNKQSGWLCCACGQHHTMPGPALPGPRKVPC